MATRKEQLSDDELQAKRKEITDIIESDPELFLAVAEKNPDGQRILKAIRRADADNAAQSQASIANTSERTVTQAEALDALELLDRTQYRRADRDFQAGSDSHGYVSGNVPMLSLIKLVEYARQQVVNDNPDLYVLQDSRSMEKNKMLFWAKDAQGYTDELSKAHRFTKSEAEDQHANRDTDVPHRVGDLNPATQDILDQAAKQVTRNNRWLDDSYQQLMGLIIDAAARCGLSDEATEATNAVMPHDAILKLSHKLGEAAAKDGSTIEPAVNPFSSGVTRSSGTEQNQLLGQRYDDLIRAINQAGKGIKGLGMPNPTYTESNVINLRNFPKNII